MLRKYNEHVLLEKKETEKVDKSAIADKIMKLFKEKPEVKSSSDKWPDAKNIYGLANIKKYVGGDSSKVDSAFHDLRDEKIKSIKVKILAYNETYPFFYHIDHTSEEEAKAAKEKMEAAQKAPEKKAVKEREAPPERKIAKKKEVDAKPKAPRKPREKKAPTEGEAKAKAKAIIRRKKG